MPPKDPSLITLGKLGVDETLLVEIVRRILSAAGQDLMILFGSAATGQLTKDSDIDGVLLIETERFEATQNVIGGIAFPAHKYDKVLYEAA